MYPFENIIVCPSCKNELIKQPNGWYCSNENFSFKISNGINVFLHPNREEILSQFLTVYQTNRNEEHWGDNNPEYYLSLPYKDISQQHTSVWKMRAKSFDIFLETIHSATLPESPLMLDLGAGNCWLSLQMAKKGYNVVASDINNEQYDGLGVISRLQSSLTSNIIAVQAEFDYLPFRHNIFDIIVMNGSLHYASDVRKTVNSIMNFLSPNGFLFIMDSPMYRNESSGKTMIENRAKQLQQQQGSKLPDEFLGSYITHDDIQFFTNKYKTTIFKPNFGLLWNIRSKLMPLLLQRETASFAVIILQKKP